MHSTEKNDKSKGSNDAGGSVENAKEVKEKKDSWVKTIGMRTLRLKKNADGSSHQQRPKMPLPSDYTASLDRPFKFKSKGSKSNATSSGSSKSDVNTDHVDGSSLSGPGRHSLRSGALSSNGPVSTAGASGESTDKQDPGRFIGEGLCFKGKLIGVLEVSGPRGDRICQEALSELKMAVKAAGEHKQKITIHIALDGMRIRDEKNSDCLYHHLVHKISFIAQDLTDARAFGYIFGSPDTGHRFFGIKTEKSASQVVIAMRDLFQVVFDLKKKEIERAKLQLEMQQKYVTTRAQDSILCTQDTATSSSSVVHLAKLGKSLSIAETYIEGACCGPGTSVPRVSSPEAVADLLNLEVELNSLQEGLDNFHNNLENNVAPFRGSTTSISSDPLNPVSKYNSAMSASSMSSSTFTSSNHPTPTPMASDPFGDSFDPYDGVKGSYGTSALHSRNLSNHVNRHNSTTSATNSITSSPFPSDVDPFSQVDPFSNFMPKYGDGDEFLNADPFETSPTVTNNCSFSFHAVSGSGSKLPDSILSQPLSQSQCEATTSSMDSHSKTVRLSNVKGAEGWTASFEDDFVSQNVAQDINEGLGGSGNSIFKELDPLGIGRNKPFVDRKDFFHDLKNPVRKVLKDLRSEPPGTVPVLHTASTSLLKSCTTNASSSSNTQEEPTIAQALAKLALVNDTTAISNSFSTNFAPSPTDSPPNYSPPPVPRQGTSVCNSEYFAGVPLSSGPTPLLPPPTLTATPPSVRRGNKKSPQLLKQMTIASAGSSPSSAMNSSPKTLPKSSYGRYSTIDSEEIPNLTPPPRPPHSNSGITSISSSMTCTKSNSMTSAVPRPMSGNERMRKISPQLSIIPPEPPPRPLSTLTFPESAAIIPSNSKSLNLVSPPPPLPPKKQGNLTMSHAPLGKAITSEGKSSNHVRATLSLRDPSDFPLPLPLPARKNQYGQTASNSSLNNQQERYAVPLDASASHASPLLQRQHRLSSSSSTVSQGPVVKLTMEQALNQVAAMSLCDLAGKLELPVEKLSALTIQQLAERLTLLDYERKMAEKDRGEPEVPTAASCGFDDDFSTASAPGALLSGNNYDKYAAFRELSMEDAMSGFSVFGTLGSSIPSISASMDKVNENSDEDQKTLERIAAASKDSSSERTLQAEDLSRDVTLGNSTMDDVTDANFSDDGGRMSLDEDDDKAEGFGRSEWATFESTFDDQFATTALVKAEEADEDNGDSPWESDEGKAKTPIVAPNKDATLAEFDFQPFEKPVEPDQQRPGSGDNNRDKRHSELQVNELSAPFKRQSSGSSRQSEHSERGERSERRTKDRDRRERDRDVRDKERSRDWDRDRDRDRDRDYIRPDSRNSYSSSRRYRNGDSDEEYSRGYRRDRGDRWGTARTGSGRRSERLPPVERIGADEADPEDEDEDDRSYASSYQSNYSSGRRHRRYHGKHHHYHTSSRGARDDSKNSGAGASGSPERYSNHESDFDDSHEEEGGVTRIKRDPYDREREYMERRRARPISSGGSGSSRHHRKESPRESYYGRDGKHHRRREQDRADIDDDYDDGRDISDYSDEVRGCHHRDRDYYRHRRHGHRRHYRERDSQARDHYYYTNSPSWDSDSGPDTPPERRRGGVRRRGSSGRYDQEELPSPGGQADRRRGSGGNAPRIQDVNSNKDKHGPDTKCNNDYLPTSHMHRSHEIDNLNDKLKPSPKGSQCPTESVSPAGVEDVESGDNSGCPPRSPFEDDFVVPPTVSQNDAVDETNKKIGSELTPPSTTANADSSPSQVFFPAKFDVEASLNLTEDTSSSPSTDSVLSPSKIVSRGSFKSESFTSRLESIRSEEEKCDNDDEPEKTKTDMKKSDSYNIFHQGRDPFADDDFFA